MASAVFGEFEIFERRFDMIERFESLMCETVVNLGFRHDDDSVLQVQHFTCLGVIFRGRHSTL